eukprot:COSAG01_NODE_1131_length_11572_cov_84.273337_10_plen_73_part_00
MLRTCEHRTKSSFQSLDYDPIASVFSEKKREMHNERKWYGYSGASVGRWVITLAVGMGIGLVAFGMSASIER